MSDHARLGRALAQMQIETVEARERHDAAIARVAAAEMIQQVHVEIRGVVNRSIGSIDVTVGWPHPFLHDVAKSQMESDLESPTFAYGVELRSEMPIIVQAQLRRWIRDERSFITSAEIRILIWGPDMPKPERFTGKVHLSFIGFAAPMEDEEED